MKRHMVHFCTAATAKLLMIEEQKQMSDCGCDKLENHVKILTEILEVRENLDKEQATPRVAMLMRVIANDLQSTAKQAQVRKELVQAAAACIMHLEKLT